MKKQIKGWTTKTDFYYSQKGCMWLRLFRTRQECRDWEGCTKPMRVTIEWEEKDNERD